MHKFYIDEKSWDSKLHILAIKDILQLLKIFLFLRFYGITFLRSINFTVSIISSTFVTFCMLKSININNIN
jgi:hypothetical protein